MGSPVEDATSGRIRAVFFDVGGTLLAPRPSLGEIYELFLRPLGIDVDAKDFRRAARETWTEFDRLVGRGGNRYGHFEGGEAEFWLRYVQRVLERVAAPERSREAAAALHAAFSDPAQWAVFDDVRPTLAALRDRGVRVGIISNWDSRLRALLDALGLAPEFETIAVSCEVGVEKPGRAIFEHALGQLGVSPHEAFHVGDDAVADYEGPREAGLRAALLVRNGTPPAGIPTVPGLQGILSLLG